MAVAARMEVRVAGPEIVVGLKFRQIQVAAWILFFCSNISCLAGSQDSNFIVLKKSTLQSVDLVEITWQS